MATIVVRFDGNAAAKRRRAATAEAAAAAPAARSTGIAAAAVAAGTCLVLASLLGGPVWARVALIAAGALLAIVGLARLAVETVAEATGAQATVRPSARRRPARPPA